MNLHERPDDVALDDSADTAYLFGQFAGIAALAGGNVHERAEDETRAEQEEQDE